MNLLDRIKLLGLVLIMLSCKKQTAPESEYLLERDNSLKQTTRTSTAVIDPVIPYQPAIADSITAIFVCQKGRYFSVNGLRSFMNSFYYYDASRPLSFDSLIKRMPTKLDLNMIQFTQGDSSDMTITYPKGNNSVHSKKGYPNCILDEFPHNCGSCFWGDNLAINYKIRFSGNNYNTDKIFSEGNGYYATLEADVKIKPSSCSSGKRCYYSIYFDNYSYFKVNSKWFVWINRIGDFCEAGH